jgi:predicted metal-binding protein
MPKIGIIRCDAYTDTCAGFKCFPALRERTGTFTAYGEVLEIVGFDTCGGCDRNKSDKVVARARRLKEKGAEAIHLGNCLTAVCPWTDLFADSIAQQVALPVVRGTH